MSDPELRRFLPGECGPNGKASQVFSESDAKPSPSSLSLAKEACQNCLQLRYCRDQREAIATVLHSKGVRLAVVGAQVVPTNQDIYYLTQRERLALEPKFQFNTSQRLPSDPTTAAVLLRQWTRIHHRAMSGKIPAISAWATNEIMAHPSLKNDIAQTTLTQQEILDVFHPLAKLLVAYTRQDAKANTWARRPHELQLSLATFQKLAPLYLADAEKIKTLDLPQPWLVFYYDADFWQRLLNAYSTSRCITQIGLKDLCRKRPRDPIPSIEAHIKRNTLRRKGIYQNPFKIPDNIRAAEVSKIIDELKDTHPYITEAMIKKAFRGSSVQAARKKIVALQEPSVAQAAEKLRGKITNVALQHCLMHTTDPQQAADNYLHRIEELTTWIKDEGHAIAPCEIETFALRALDGRTITEIVQTIEAVQIRRDFTQSCKRLKSTSHVPGWAFEKIVRHHNREEWWEIAANLNQFIEMRLLRIDYLSCALETEVAEIEGFIDHAVSKKGAYVIFTPEAHSRYDPSSLAALVRSAKLDLLVYGHPLPDDADIEVDPPIWFDLAEMTRLQEYIRRGANATRILNGEVAMPRAVLIEFGWPDNPQAQSNALSAIRNSALRGRVIKRAHDRARIRQTRQQEV